MPSCTRSQIPPTTAHAEERSRAAHLRDAAGRFTKGATGASAKPTAAAEQPDAGDCSETVEIMASLEFEACDPNTPMLNLGGWTKRLSQHALGMSVTDRLLRMGKPEMIAYVEKVASRGSEALSELVDLIHETRLEMECLASLAGTAEARLFVAASSSAVSPKPDEA